MTVWLFLVEAGWQPWAWATPKNMSLLSIMKTPQNKS